MKNKRVYAASFICVLVWISAMTGPIISEEVEPSTYKDEKDTETSFSSTNLDISLEPARFGYGTNLILTNQGNQGLKDITWSFRGKPVITGTGLIRQSQSSQGTINELKAGETATGDGKINRPGITGNGPQPERKPSGADPGK